jgi:outer membrane lipoprotein-sorting protein
MIIRKIVFPLFLFFTFSLIAKSQSADEIIAKYIAFIGGVQKWKKIKTITSSGTYNYGGMEFPFTAWSKAPDLYKYEVTSNGKSFNQAYDGRVGWKIDGFKDETQKTTLKGKQATAMANESDVELESPFIDYQKKGHTVLLEGKDTIDKKVCYKIKLTRKNGNTETYYFDIGNYELVKKQAISKNTELDNSMLDILNSDYHTLEGITIPQKISCISNGQTILIITVKDIKLNLPLADSIFKP